MGNERSGKSGIISEASALSASLPFRLLAGLDGWHLIVILSAAIIITPLTVIFGSFINPAWDIWKHFADTLLIELISNTLWLILGVGTTTLLLGVGLAWLTASYDFPGRAFFSWGLLLPLAIPTYVLAFTALGIFDFSGPVQSLLRELFGKNFWFPEIRSPFGVSLVMGLALYPYVYLLARSAFLSQGSRALEVAQSLGYSRRNGFFKVALPMARPWIAAGLLLVLMETLADFGAVSIFNYDTFTTAIYKAWFGFFSLSGAAQLSSILVTIAFLLVTLESSSRARMRYYQPGKPGQPGQRVKLSGRYKWGALFIASSVFFVAFALPVGQLIIWSVEVFSEEFGGRYFDYLGHSLLLAFLAMATITTFSLLVAYANRRHADKLTKILVRISNLGYALPGTVLAVGIFMPIAVLDNILVDIASSWFGVESSGFIRNSIAIMILAYLCRFLSAGYQSVETAMHRITHSIDEAALLAGEKGLSLLRKIHFPLLRGGLLTGATLVFIDVMKEMPITLMTRPFGWDTLSIKIFELTSEGEWERAALPALTLVLAGLIPIALLTRAGEVGKGS